MATQTDYECQIGNIVVSASLLDSLFRSGIRQMIGGQYGLIVSSARLSFDQTAALFSSLYTTRLSNEEDVGKVEDLCKKIIGMNAERNKFAHSVWYRTEGYEGMREKLKTLKIGRPPEYDHEEVDLDDLEDFALQMESTVFELIDLMHPGWDS